MRPEKGLNWIGSGLGYSQYNHALPPNHPSCTIAEVNISALTTGSHHNGGANALSMDGSVHFVKDSTDTRVWSAQGTRSGGEVAGLSKSP
jgi:hypothetical protein